jgi:hypothetical protein
MESPSCSLWFLVACTDVPFMMHTIPHIIRMCNYPFSQKVVVVDTSPLSGDYISRPCIGTLTELQKCCDNLLTSGVINKIISIDFSENYKDKVYRKHLGKFIRQTHNYRGAPVLGYIFLLEQVHSGYLVHFNADMLLYQDSNYNWIEEGIKAMRQYPDIICVTPLSGPSTKDGILHQNVPYERDPRGFYRFKQFTSRKFLVDIKRFEKLLPLKILWKVERRSLKLPHLFQTILNFFTVGRKLDKWEIMVSNRLKETSFFRVDLDTPSAWALHSSQTHDWTFVQNLPQIIKKIESGWYPSMQAGHYDLHLQSWLEAMK